MPNKVRPLSQVRADDLTVDFINHDDIQSFADALAYDEYNESPFDISRNGSISIPNNTNSHSSSSLNLLNTSGMSTPPVFFNSNHPWAPPSPLKTVTRKGSVFQLISSQNDWSPVYPNSHKRRPRNSPSSSSSATNTLGGNSKSNKNNNTDKLKDKPKKQKKKKSETSNIFQDGWTFTLVRYPALFFIFLWLGFLSIVYLFIRIYVALFELYFAWTGERSKLREKLRHSKNYEEWIVNAKKLDKYLGFDKWQDEDVFFCYDYRTLRKINKKLKYLRENKNSEELMVILQGCIKSNFAGTENPLLYSQCYYGTKKLIETYNNEVVQCLNYISNETQIPLEEKRLFYRIISRNFGKTALCLSGGASFAYTHYGIIKAMLDNDLMPKIISGTSGGGLVASLACTRTTEELKNLINPKLACKMTACSDPMSVWLPRWWRTGARFDAVDWAEKCSWWTIGSLTFKEAHERTGKILNISTVPNDPHSPVILCNHITSPNCVIWSALLASAAVPGILNPVVLMMKNKDGSVSPFSFGNRWKDGSMRTDIPVEALNTYYNAKFSIVSQVNPHIALFFYAPKGSVGRPVARRKGTVGFRGGFLGAALENLVKLDITKWLKLIKEFDLLPSFKDSDWSNIFLQRFSGTITLWPKIKLTDFYYILSDPTEERLADMIFNGEICAYPKLLFIRHRLNIERAIENGRRSVKSQLARASSNAATSNTASFNLSEESHSPNRRNVVFNDDDDDFTNEKVGYFDHSDDFHDVYENDDDDDESDDDDDDDDEYQDADDHIIVDEDEDDNDSGDDEDEEDEEDEEEEEEEEEEGEDDEEDDDGEDDEEYEYEDYQNIGKRFNTSRNLYVDDTGIYNNEDFLNHSEDDGDYSDDLDPSVENGSEYDVYNDNDNYSNSAAVVDSGWEIKVKKDN